MFFGTITFQTAWNSLSVRKEARICAGKCPAIPGYEGFGPIFVATLWTQRVICFPDFKSWRVRLTTIQSFVLGIRRNCVWNWCGFRPMLNSNHEDAATRIVVHIQNTLRQRMRSAFVRTVDRCFQIPCRHIPWYGCCSAICGYVGFTVPTPFVPAAAGSCDYRHCQCVMLFQAVTLPKPSMVRAIHQLGLGDIHVSEAVCWLCSLSDA